MSITSMGIPDTSREEFALSAKTQRLPDQVNPPFGGSVHDNFVRPGPPKSFALPFAGRVNSHLRAVILDPRGMVQGVSGTQDKFHIPFRINGTERFPGHLPEILDADVVVDDDNHLGEHGLAEGPDGVHDLSGMAGVGFSD